MRTWLFHDINHCRLYHLTTSVQIHLHQDSYYFIHLLKHFRISGFVLQKTIPQDSIFEVFSSCHQQCNMSPPLLRCRHGCDVFTLVSHRWRHNFMHEKQYSIVMLNFINSNFHFTISCSLDFHLFFYIFSFLQLLIFISFLKVLYIDRGKMYSLISTFVCICESRYDFSVFKHLPLCPSLHPLDPPQSCASVPPGPNLGSATVLFYSSRPLPGFATAVKL